MDSSMFLTPSTRVLRTSTPRLSVRNSSKKKAFVRPVCGKEYRCHRSFLKHQRGHAIIRKSNDRVCLFPFNITESASKYPITEEIVEHLHDNIGNTFQKLKLNPACSAKGQKYKEFLQMIIESYTSFSDLDEWNNFTNIIHSALVNGLQDSRFLLPSSLAANLQKNSEQLLSDISTRQHLTALFQVFAAAVDEEMIQFFLADYVFFLVSYIIKFVRERVKNTSPLVPEKGLEVIDNDYLESVYYIGGAKLHAFDKKARKFSKDKGWRNIGRVINERLIESDTNPGPPAHVKGWTVAQNRGKLLFISGLMFDFFCGVVIILEKQGLQRKVDYADVTEKVCESGVILLWDEAVGDSMIETDSFKFMNGLIEAFCQTFTVRKAQKMLNSIRKKGEAPIPLRHKVAPKTSDKPSTSK